MKKILKMSVVLAAIAGVGYVAYKGLKRLIDKADCCGYCDCDDYMGNCECDCRCTNTCECDCHDKPAEETSEVEVKTNATAEVTKVDVEEKPTEENAEVSAAE